MAFQVLIPLALAAAQAKGEANKRKQANNSAALNNAFAPLTNSQRQEFDNSNNTVGILATGAVGSLNASQQLGAANAANQLDSAKFGALQNSLQAPLPPANSTLNFGSGRGFGNLV